MWISFSILNSIISFILILYGDPVYPRKIVQVVVHFMDHFIRKVYLPSLKSEILEILEKGCKDDLCSDEIEQCFMKYSNVFKPVATEHKRFKLLRKKGFFEYEEFIIGEKFSEKLVESEVRLVPEFIYGVYVPLRKTLKLFLEIPGMFDQILDYIKKLSQESYVITNILQGNFFYFMMSWK